MRECKIGEILFEIYIQRSSKATNKIEKKERRKIGSMKRKSQEIQMQNRSGSHAPHVYIKRDAVVNISTINFMK